MEAWGRNSTAIHCYVHTYIAVSGRDGGRDGLPGSLGRRASRAEGAEGSSCYSILLLHCGPLFPRIIALSVPRPRHEDVHSMTSCHGLAGRVEPDGNMGLDSFGQRFTRAPSSTGEE